MCEGKLGDVRVWGNLCQTKVSKGQVGEVSQIEGELTTDVPETLNILSLSRKPIQYEGSAEVDGEIVKIKVAMLLKPELDGASFYVTSTGPLECI